ncbi:MAG: hypothetical protein WAM24_20850 [Ignavibacteriaceae bacterium]
MKISEAKLREAIVKKFGSQANFAKKMGLTEGQVSRGIKSQTTKYILKFRESGINIDSLMQDEEGKRKGNLEFELKIAEKRIKELEALLVQKDSLLEQKDNLIKSYELVMKEQFKDKQ